MTFQKRKSQFLEFGYSGRESSEEISKEIDNEVKKIIFDSYARVKNILLENKGRLQVLAKRLLEKEVIEGEELREIISHNLPDPKNNTL